MNVQYELIFRARSHPFTHKVRNLIIILNAVDNARQSGMILQSNRENREHQKHFSNVIVLQEKSQSGVRKLNRKQDQFVVLWLVRVS